MKTQTGPRRADIALRVSFTNPLASGSENLSYLTPGFGMFVVFLSLRWHLAQYSYGEGGRIKTKQESDHLSRNDPFVLPISEIDIIMEKLS